MLDPSRYAVFFKVSKFFNENEYEILCDFDNITSCSVKLKKQSIGSGTCAYGIHLI